VTLVFHPYPLNTTIILKFIKDIKCTLMKRIDFKNQVLSRL
jgi:hypothetical protein